MWFHPSKAKDAGNWAENKVFPDANPWKFDGKSKKFGKTEKEP